MITRSLAHATESLPFTFSGFHTTYFKAGSSWIVYGDMKYNLEKPLNPPVGAVVRAVFGDRLSFFYDLSYTRDEQVLAYE